MADLGSLSREGLIAVILEQQRLIEELRAEIEKLKRSQHRSAAPMVMAAAHTLHYAMGVPVRRVPGILQELTGVKLTQSAVTQDALRRADGPAGAAYKQLRGQVRHDPMVHTDDTGWRIGGDTAFLMGFDTDQVTAYQIRDQHRNQEVREIIPSDYTGVWSANGAKATMRRIWTRSPSRNVWGTY